MKKKNTRAIRKNSLTSARLQKIFSAFVELSRQPNGKRNARKKYHLASRYNLVLIVELAVSLKYYVRYKRIKSRQTPGQSNPSESFAQTFQSVVLMLIKMGMK